MDDQPKSEHAGAAFEAVDGGVNLTVSGLVGKRFTQLDGGSTVMLGLPSLDSVRAIRDAANSFLAFHERGAH